MRLVLFFMLLLLTQLSYSQVILVPGNNVPLHTYLNKCQTEGYRCTQNYFKTLLMNESSENFDHFLVTIDLQNEDYRKNFPVLIKNLLKQENLSLDQVSLLIKVISKYESLEINLQLSEMKNEIKDLLTILEGLTEERSEAETYFIYRKAISSKQYSQLRYKIKYSRVMRITPFQEPNSVFENDPLDLVSGSCENTRFSKWFSKDPSLRYVALFDEECKITNAFAASSADFNLSSIQKPLIYTVLAATAVFFLSRYEIQIQY